MIDFEHNTSNKQDPNRGGEGGVSLWSNRVPKVFPCSPDSRSSLKPGLKDTNSAEMYPWSKSIEPLSSDFSVLEI